MEKRFRVGFSRLASELVHEIRNPLNSILTLTEVLRQEIPPSETTTPYFDHIGRQVETLARLMRNLQEYAVLPQAQNFTLEDLAEICQSVANNFVQGEDRKKRHPIQCHLRSKTHFIYADSGRLPLAFAHILQFFSLYLPAEVPIQLEIMPVNGSGAKISLSSQIPRGTSLPRIRPDCHGFYFHLAKLIFQDHHARLRLFLQENENSPHIEIEFPHPTGDIHVRENSVGG